MIDSLTEKQLQSILVLPSIPNGNVERCIAFKSVLEIDITAFSFQKGFEDAGACVCDSVVS